MNDDHNHERTRTLITDEWRITLFSDHGELYNLKNDINEINNVWNDKTLKDIKLDLLLKLFKKTNNLSNPVMRDCGF